MGRSKKRKEKRKRRRNILIIIISIFFLITSIYIFINKKEKTEEQIIYKFYATVIERTNEGILVSPNKGELVNKKYPILNIALENKIVDENIQKDDLIKVEYKKEKFEQQADKMIVEKIEEINYSKKSDLYLTILKENILEDNNENIQFIQIDKMFIDNKEENLEELLLIYLKKYNKNIFLGDYIEYVKRLESKEFKNGKYIVINKLEKIEEDKYKIDVKKYTNKDNSTLKQYIVKYNQNKWEIL